MLVGSNLPIFGDDKHPAVSLRLTDASKPTNILTGIDYWLDNLMCNVPEVAMCFHLDGIVQGYELIKTEDIPRIKNSSFSPSVIRDTAESLLEFLKRNCTKEGGTYWLFKAAGDDVVKLYDLSTLTSDPSQSTESASSAKKATPWGNSEGEKNPFAFPVAMLLYRAARNMSQSKTENNPVAILRLLINCLKLLDRKTHADMYSTVSFMIVELLLHPDLMGKKSVPEIPDGVRNRYLTALDYLEGGMGSLKLLGDGTQPSSPSSPTATLPQSSPPASTGEGEMRFQQMAWKMVETYSSLGRNYFESNHLGKTLACALRGLIALQGLVNTQDTATAGRGLLQDLMVLYADASFGVFKVGLSRDEQQWKSERTDYEEEMGKNTQFASTSSSSPAPFDLLEPFTIEVPESWNKISQFYFRAISVLPESRTALGTRKKIAGIENEVGVYYMNKEDYVSAQKHFLEAASGFERTHDFVNTGLIHCNLGKLVRLSLMEGGGELSEEEIDAHRKAIYHYQTAQQCLKKAAILASSVGSGVGGEVEESRVVLPDVFPVLCESVNHELAKAKFALGSLLQDYPPLTKLSVAEVEKEIAAILLDGEDFFVFPSNPPFVFFKKLLFCSWC